MGRGRALERSYAIAIAIAGAAVAALAILVFIERLGISGPSLTDDWLYASITAGEMWDLADPLSPADRFRPSFEFTSYLQWHVLGAPGSLLAPDLWSFLRLALFTCALVVPCAVVAATSERRPDPIWLGVLVAAAGLVVFSSPVINVDFVRLGPQEVFLFGAMIFGGALIIWATGRVLGGVGGSPLVVTGYTAGFLLWILGAYYKEASVCALLIWPFVYLFLDRRWREQGRIEAPLWRAREFQLVSTAIILPLLHVGLTSALIGEDGVSIYGAEPPDGINGWAARLRDSLQVQWDAFAFSDAIPHRWVGVLAFVGAIALSAYRRRVQWLALGLAIGGWALLVFQGILLAVEPRYLIPVIALFACSAVLLLAESPAWLQTCTGVAALVLAVSNLGDANEALDAWRDYEEDATRAVNLVADIDPERCPVYVINLGLEAGLSVPASVALTEPPPDRRCPEQYEGVLFGLKQTPPPPLAAGDELEGACADPPGGEPIAKTDGWKLLGCRRFRSTIGAREVGEILRESRLAPGYPAPVGPAQRDL